MQKYATSVATAPPQSASKAVVWFCLAVLASLSVFVINGRPLFYFDTLGYIQQGHTALRHLGWPAESPLSGRPAEVVEQVAMPLLEDPALPMSTLIYEIVRPEEIDDPNHVKTVFDRDNYALYFSRSPIPFQRNPDEGVKPTYYKHLGFYGYRKGFLLSFVALPEGEWEKFEKLEQLRALEYGYKIKVTVTEHDSIEVDTPEDLLRVEQFLRQE